MRYPVIHIEQLLKGVLLNDGEIVKRTWQIENETNYVTETNRGNRKKKVPRLQNFKQTKREFRAVTVAVQ
jgi:hypothetical protein